MSKLFSTLLLLSLLISLAHSDCFGEDCAFNAEGNPQKQASISEAVKIIDEEIRRVYWYYLRRSNIIYSATIDTPERFLLFFIYRNVVGTFLCITSWNKAEQNSEINTFVRLGNGYSRDIETPYSPVRIQPFIISLRLAHGEYLIEMDENGDFKVNGKLISVDEDEENLTADDIDEKIKKIDEYARKRYWYYLSGRDEAILVHSERIVTSLRVYVVLTYINIVGTFLGIFSCDKADNIYVNTFVRLGGGYKSTNLQVLKSIEMKPIEIKPSVIDIY